MKTLKYILSALILFTAVLGCTEDELGSTDFVDSAVAPTNITTLFDVTQDNTGLVTITPNSEGAVSYAIYYGDDTTDPTTISQGESIEHTYAEGNYDVVVIAKGITGLKTQITFPIVVSFKAPENLVVEITNDTAVSKQVNVTATADYALAYDVYFGEEGNDEPVSGNIGDTVSYVYAEAGTYTIRVVAKSAAIETTEYTQEFEAVAIVQPITSAPTQPSRVDSDVISIFSSVYTDIEGTNYNPDWGQSGQGSSYAMFDLGGDQMLNYINLSYQGISIGETVDVSAMEYLHMDVWTADLVQIKTSLINGVDGTSTEAEITSDLNADEWTSINIPISDYLDLGLSVDQIFQLKFVGEPWAGGTVFIDNIYFYKEPTEFADLPITFDSSIETFVPFLDADFEITEDPEDSTNPVGKITNIGQGWGWEGVKLHLDKWIDTSANSTITMDFYNDGVEHDVLLKLEDTTSELDSNGNPTVLEEVHVTVSNTGWSTLSFDFTSGGSFDSVVLFVDGGVYNITGTYYIDNIMYSAK